jgi:hypothetical protein
MAVLDAEQHREMFSGAGFTEIRIFEKPARGWICGVGSKPV